MGGCARSVEVNWIPSHVGIRGNEMADTLARQGAQEPEVSHHIPAEVRQLLTHIRGHAETRRLQQVREARLGNSASARWHGDVCEAEGDARQQTPRGVTRLWEVVRARIRLGYPYKWQIGIATPDSEKQCRLCRQSEGHTLEHYLRECATVNPLREKCLVPSPTLAELAAHFVNILSQTLSSHPDFCAIDT